ncbi:MAG: 1-deoxy-D-xylulose-5-phosphate synthase, partial [Zetaproteobacteria bacterium]
RFIKPWDRVLVRELAGSDRPVVVVEEGVAAGGIGEAIAAFLHREGWRGAFRHLALDDAFPPQGTRAEILAEMGLDSEGIARTLSEIR